MPRVYCEKMKRRKHVIDQYPNTKKVAAWLVGRYKLTIMFLPEVVGTNILSQYFDYGDNHEDDVKDEPNCVKALKHANNVSQP